MGEDMTENEKAARELLLEFIPCNLFGIESFVQNIVLTDKECENIAEGDESIYRLVRHVFPDKESPEPVGIMGHHWNGGRS